MEASMKLTDEEKQALLQIARTSIQSAVEGLSLPIIKNVDETLRQPRGVFVTLRVNEELRGCIGYVEPLFPLAQATQDVAVKAAMEDPRFLPLSTAELESVTIEISVLSPLEILHDIENVEIGKHGLVISAGYRRGLLLPQVATEYNWDRKQFLNHTAMKAGLSPDAWTRKEAQLFTFTVEKFDESCFQTSKREDDGSG
jgi:AmmeMemoRadiSam system protein A